MTRRESAIIGAFTGILCGSFKDLHEYVEELMGRSVFMHELGSEGFEEMIKEKSRYDFLELCKSVENSAMKEH